MHTRFDTDIRSAWLTALGFASVSLIFGGLFAKDLVAEFFLDFSRRNFYGAVALLTGCALAFAFIVFSKRFSVFAKTLLDPLIVGWIVVLLVIAPATSYAFRGHLYISPHAGGFVAAMACFLVSPRMLKIVLSVTLGFQFCLLLYEYDTGISLTPTMNEALGAQLPVEAWLLDRDIGLIRAKGMLDSTHDSTWLFFYSAFIFKFATVVLVFMCIAAWMAQGRLGIMATALLALFGHRPLRIVAILAVVAIAASIAYPQKMFGGVAFFFQAFNPNTNSNTYRVEASKDALDYLSKGREQTQQQHTMPATPAAHALRLLFGVSGIALVSGEVKTEMSYTLFLLEYGIAGLVLMVWTILRVGRRGLRFRLVPNLVFAGTMLLLMLSSSVQSASSFFMFWLAALFLGVMTRATSSAPFTT